MQFGFTEGLSPNMAALILSEVCSNITAKDILFITTLGVNFASSKFDVFCCNTILISRFSAVQLLYSLFYFFDGYNYFLFLFRF
jgi:hypothetical protein